MMEDQCNDNNTIILTTENEAEYLYSTKNKLFVTVGMPLAAAFGIINNLAFLFVLYRVKRMRTTTNFYLGNLAVSDAGFLLTSCTRHVWTYLALAPVEFGTAWWSGFGCSAPYFITYVPMYNSVFLVTIVTAERYFAICHPMTHKRLDGRGRAVKLVLISWMLSIAFATFEANPASVETTCLQFPKDSHQSQVAGHLLALRKCIVYCGWCWNATYFVDTIQFIFAFVASLVMYLKIVKTLSMRDSVTGGSSDDLATRESMMKARNAVARMLAVNSVVFFVCLFPFKITNVYDIVLILGGPELMSYEAILSLGWVGRILTLINASINPFIYGVTNARYRIAFYEAITCGYTAKKDTASFSHISRTVNTNV